LAMDAIPLAHVIVAGPPCPPWSPLGSGVSFNDPRADVFNAVIEIISPRPIPESFCFSSWRTSLA
jgi:site-specific DNA-cytosine methylase